MSEVAEEPVAPRKRGRPKKVKPAEEVQVIEEAPQEEVAPVDKSSRDGWIAITKDFKIMQEQDGITEDNPGGGRPVDLGNEGGLVVCGVRGNGHSAAVDLINGRVIIDYERLGVQNGTIEIENAKLLFEICEETNIVGEFKHRKTTRPNKQGDYLITYSDMVFRPIWFTRNINTLPGPVFVVGAQTTTPSEMGRRNIKKIISLYPDGRVGIS